MPFLAYIYLWGIRGRVVARHGRVVARQGRVVARRGRGWHGEDPRQAGSSVISASIVRSFLRSVLKTLVTGT
jgi:hypothetical protein